MSCTMLTNAAGLPAASRRRTNFSSRTLPADTTTSCRAWTGWSKTCLSSSSNLGTLPSTLGFMHVETYWQWEAPSNQPGVEKREYTVGKWKGAASGSSWWAAISIRLSKSSIGGISGAIDQHSQWLGAVLGRPSGRANELWARSVIESWSIYLPLYLRDSQVNCGVCPILCFALWYSNRIHLISHITVYQQGLDQIWR